MQVEKSLADKLFPDLNEQEVNDSILSIPPEKRRLHTETYDFSISTIIDYLESNHIYIPNFQRHYVWTDVQASRLIESLIIQCPIPVIYLSQDKDERLAVIDGNQRIRSLKRYIKNEFMLKGLTSYPELENCRFFELDPRFQRHILNRTLRCIVIMKDTHPQVKFDVFERLNTGAVQLKPQELRHGLYHGKLMDIAEHLAKNKLWSSFFVIKSNKRMKIEEFILRFFALSQELAKYEKPLSDFLNRFAEKYREPDQDTQTDFETRFKELVENVDRVFGKSAFRIFDKQGQIQSAFNAALFDAETLALYNLRDKLAGANIFNREEFTSKLPDLFTDTVFFPTISRATSDEASMKKRVQIMTAFISEHI
ncbi:MAG: DUF262 domain-containing protein [Syntrophobacteraceae bacterium]|nr:DUF262 domain-containing protein [Syntrophobacteraceae bacterium]